MAFLIVLVTVITLNEGIARYYFRTCGIQPTKIAIVFNIIKHGRVMKSANESERVRFETLIHSRYLDEKYYLQRHNRLVLKRMAARGLR